MTLIEVKHLEHAVLTAVIEQDPFSFGRCFDQKPSQTLRRKDFILGATLVIDRCTMPE